MLKELITSPGTILTMLDWNARCHILGTPKALAIQYSTKYGDKYDKLTPD